MHVFVTGGTGLIGSAVVTELLRHGHSVLALARSEASTLAVKQAGVQPIRGELADLEVLRAGAAETDGVIHLAFSNDFSSADAVARAVTEETAALTVLGASVVGTDPPPGHGLRYALGAGAHFHRSRSAAGRRAGRRPRTDGHRHPGPCLGRGPKRGRAAAANGPQRR